ncbi:MAG: hypothetical protein Q8P84_08105, partial [Deltaproteobacteria bacterium]|nr:hypothetical protein [Deltaproteobacteria bacterium]
ERGVLPMREREDVFHFFHSVAAMLNKNPPMQKIAEKIRARLLVVALALKADDFVKVLRKELKEDLSAEAREAARDQWMGMLLFIKKMPASPEVAQHLSSFLPQFAPLFLPETGRHAVALGYLEVCRVHLLLGEEAKGKSAFDEAVRLSGAILKKEGYWERIVQELFEPIIQSPKADERELDHASAALSLADGYRAVLPPEVAELLPQAWSFLREKYAASIVLERKEWIQERRSNFPTMHNANRKAPSPK